MLLSIAHRVGPHTHMHVQGGRVSYPTYASPTLHTAPLRQIPFILTLPPSGLPHPTNQERKTAPKASP